MRKDMIDIGVMINAARQLNQAWDECCAEVSKEVCPPDVYDAILEIDKALIVLTEKIGACAGVCAVTSIRE